MKTGEFIRWSSTDDEGPFHYVGQITKLGEDYVEFQDNPAHGVMHVPLSEGVFTKASKPKTWKAVRVKKDKPVPVVKPKPAKKTRAPKSGSKKEQAKEMFEAARVAYQPSEFRAAIIKTFIESLSMSKAGAATYYSNFNSGRW